LIFRDNLDNYFAKLIDFGYSSGFMGADVIMMPRTQPWDAPEYHSRGFERKAAVKMDVYSFGMVCLWLLFNERFSEPVTISLDSAKGERVLISFSKPSGGDFVDQRTEYLTELKSKDKMCEFSHQFIMATDTLDDLQKNDLILFFNSTLVLDPNSRNTDFKELLLLLGQNR
jgi:serine/threonine protein kinase